MTKTKIEWCDFTINPIKGLCKYACSYCYARTMYKRFKWNPEIRFDWFAFAGIESIKKSSRIFVGSMHDIFGEWIPDNRIQDIISICKFYKKHTFLFLTKNPKRYLDFKFPLNCWLGTTITGYSDNHLLTYLENVKHVNKFISYEPMLDNFKFGLIFRVITNINWVIAGGLTPKPVHKKEWIDDMVEILKLRNIPLFIKNNAKYPKKIQEFPKGR